MNKQKHLIKTKDKNGNNIELEVLRPGHKIMQEANMAYNLKVSSLLRQANNGGERLLLRSEVEDHLIKSGVWSNKDAKDMESLGMRLRALELVIKQGGIKLSEARKLAVEMSQIRSKMMILYNKKQQLDSVTVESVAEQYKFGILMVKCVLSAKDGRPYFMGYDDYLEKSGDLAAIETAQCLSKMLYGLDDGINLNFFENQWLKEHNFIDDKGRLISKDGYFVDKDGKRIDKNGRFIDEHGNFVDRNGIQVDKNGNFIVEDQKPFLDDDGNPIDNNIKKTKKLKSKSKSRKKVKA